ncbi:Nucleolar complex protein 4-like protein B [Bienertia sinuspersici]
MASKKSKSTTTSNSQKKRSKRTLSDLKTLGQQLLSSRAYINNLPLLLPYVSPSSPPSYLVESLLSLQSFFSPVISSLPPSSSAANAAAASDPEFIYRTWLRSKFDDFINSLIDILVSPHCEESIFEVVLETLMESVKLGNGGKFYSVLYHKFILAIVNSPLEVESLLESLASTYFKYIDVRYFTFIAVEKLCKTLESNNNSGDEVVIEEGDDSKASLECSIKKIHFILSHIPPLGNLDENAAIEMWSEGFLSKEDKNTEGKNKQKKVEKPTGSDVSLGRILKKMKLKFTKAWMSFLRLPLPLEVYKEVLVNLHQAVIPHLSNPVIDFLTRSYDIGGVVSVMSLGGLFVLMTKYGLEYPNFYEKLYALLIPSIFMAKHRAKFFELLDACLKSPLLPGHLAAAFAKKLSRLSLAIPPYGSLVIIALVHNILRRHPSINCLVHREAGEKVNQGDTKSEQETVTSDGNTGVSSELVREKQGVDLFKDEESDPLRSQAMRSSLWEIDTLRHHYCPPVSRFVLSLENDLTVRAKTTEVKIGDFSSGSYSTIFRDEMRRRVKQVPLAFYKAMPTSLFLESDFPGWTFNYAESTVET